jgi:hypothetical protein
MKGSEYTFTGFRCFFLVFLTFRLSAMGESCVLLTMPLVGDVPPALSSKTFTLSALSVSEFVFPILNFNESLSAPALDSKARGLMLSTWLPTGSSALQSLFKQLASRELLLLL